MASGERTPPPTHDQAAPRREGEYRPKKQLDLRTTVGIQLRGRGDPAMSLDAHRIWRASNTPEGVATIVMQQDASGTVRASAWGPGADWAMSQLPSLCGARDDADEFNADMHPDRKSVV